MKEIVIILSLCFYRKTLERVFSNLESECMYVRKSQYKNCTLHNNTHNNHVNIAGHFPNTFVPIYSKQVHAICIYVHIFYVYMKQYLKNMS